MALADDEYDLAPELRDLTTTGVLTGSVGSESFLGRICEQLLPDEPSPRDRRSSLRAVLSEAIDGLSDRTYPVRKYSRQGPLRNEVVQVSVERVRSALRLFLDLDQTGRSAYDRRKAALVELGVVTSLADFTEDQTTDPISMWWKRVRGVKVQPEIELLRILAASLTRGHFRGPIVPDIRLRFSFVVYVFDEAGMLGYIDYHVIVSTARWAGFWEISGPWSNESFARPFDVIDVATSQGYYKPLCARNSKYSHFRNPEAIEEFSLGPLPFPNSHRSHPTFPMRYRLIVTEGDATAPRTSIHHITHSDEDELVRLFFHPDMLPEKVMYRINEDDPPMPVEATHRQLYDIEVGRAKSGGIISWTWRTDVGP